MGQLFSDNYLIFLGAFLAMISGLSIRISLSLAKQKWASTYHHTMSYILLPLITLVITKVISGNIALSLGMIGALSIVRFRDYMLHFLSLNGEESLEWQYSDCFSRHDTFIFFFTLSTSPFVVNCDCISLKFYINFLLSRPNWVAL